MNDGNNDRTEAGLLSFEKMKLFGDMIMELESYQQHPYDIDAHVQFGQLRALFLVAPPDEEQIMELSYAVQPRIVLPQEHIGVAASFQLPSPDEWGAAEVCRCVAVDGWMDGWMYC